MRNQTTLDRFLSNRKGVKSPMLGLPPVRRACRTVQPLYLPEVDGQFDLAVPSSGATSSGKPSESSSIVSAVVKGNSRSSNSNPSGSGKGGCENVHCNEQAMQPTPTANKRRGESTAHLRRCKRQEVIVLDPIASPPQADV